MFQFDRKKLQIHEKLGRGFSGTVYPYQKDPQDLRWVIKFINADDIEFLLESLQQIVLGFACDHPRILPLKGYSIDQIPNQCFEISLKLPRMKTDLLSNWKDRKRKNLPYSEQEIVHHFYSLVCALEYLHNKKIFHGDIKPSNLLLSDNEVLYLSDLSIAKYVEDEDTFKTPTGQLGTYNYSAPEILARKETISKNTLEKADIWSVGVVILELCIFDIRLVNGVMPHDELQSRLDKYFKALDGKYHNFLITLIKKILSLDPKERPSTHDIRQELEKNFSAFLVYFLTYERVKLCKVHANEKLLNDHLQELTEKFENEIKQLQQTISDLESALSQQNQRYEEREALNHALEEKIKFLEQELRKMKESDSSQTKPQEKDFSEEKLKTVIMELNNEIFTASEEKKNLKIRHNEEKWLTNDKITDEHLISLSKRLITLLQKNNLFNLPGLEIECWGCNKLTDKAFVNLIKTINDPSFCLQHLSLSFAWCQQLTDNISTELSLLIRNKDSHLKHLTLDFRKCQQLSDKALIELSSALSSQVLHLEHLNLDYGGCKELTDMALIELSRAISSQSLSLQHLSLNFGGCEKLTDQSLSHFKTELRSLKELKLNFINCTELTDKGLESLVKLANNKVDHLSLDFGGCQKLTDKGLERTALAISTLSSDLQHLNLNFYDCKGLTDRVLASLAKAFKNKSRDKLQYLGLDFRSIPNLSDNGVGVLSTAIEESFKNLQQLKLTFSTKGNITSEMKEKLKKKFALLIQKLEIV